MDRREFLKRSAGVAALSAVAPGAILAARAPSDPIVCFMPRFEMPPLGNLTENMPLGMMLRTARLVEVPLRLSEWKALPERNRPALLPRSMWRDDEPA